VTETLGMVTLVVREYDEAIAYFVGALGFTLIEDKPLSATKRWVVVGPGEGSGAQLLLAKAADETQWAFVGNQAGGRVFLFLYTAAFDATHARFAEAGVRFIEAPRQEAWGKVAVFEDLYGNRWDLIERQ
jgi:catechol 2,3-dioxygenase-like lactoylglutathione lyase family enzyme